LIHGTWALWARSSALHLSWRGTARTALVLGSHLLLGLDGSTDERMTNVHFLSAFFCFYSLILPILRIAKAILVGADYTQLATAYFDKTRRNCNVYLRTSSFFRFFDIHLGRFCYGSLLDISELRGGCGAELVLCLRKVEVEMSIKAEALKAKIFESNCIFFKGIAMWRVRAQWLIFMLLILFPKSMGKTTFDEKWLDKRNTAWGMLTALLLSRVFGRLQSPILGRDSDEYFTN